MVMNVSSFILASISPRRADLLREFKYEFSVVPSGAEEINFKNLSAGELARLNAFRKAQAVSKKHPDAVVLGVDTVVVFGREVFGKPSDAADAERMVMALQGQTHQVVTGVCLIHLQSRHQRLFYEQTDVTFRKMTPAQVRQYHAKVNPLDKAGAYGIQEKGVTVVESIAGSRSNVAGLPMERLQAELAKFGIHPLAGRV
jgi:septum formation protein